MNNEWGLPRADGSYARHGLPYPVRESPDRDMGWGHFGHCPVAEFGDELHGECSCDQMYDDPQEEGTQ